MSKEIHHRKGDKHKKPNREIRIKTERHRPKGSDTSEEDIRELQREIARQQGFHLCNDCNQYTPLENLKCIHCHS